MDYPIESPIPSHLKNVSIYRNKRAPRSVADVSIYINFEISIYKNITEKLSIYRHLFLYIETFKPGPRPVNNMLACPRAREQQLYDFPVQYASGRDDSAMKCRLCQQSSDLCESHIIPEFLYKTMYSKEKHQFIQLSGPPKVRKWQKGFKEKLLCRECEDKLNKCETYAARVLFGGTEIGLERMQDAIIVRDVDYQKFKLFQLSLIWRAGASALQQFSNVNLGPHDETLRSMIEKDEPGVPTDYGCLIILTPSYFDLTSNMMMLAQETRFDGHRCYMFLMAGFTWVFFVSSHMRQLPYSEKLFLRLDGVLPVLIENAASKGFFEKTFAEWKKSGNIDEALKRI